MSKPAVSDIGLKTLKQWLVSPNEAPYPVAVVDLQEDRATSVTFEQFFFRKIEFGKQNLLEFRKILR